MEIIDYNKILDLSRDFTLKALDKDLIPVNKENPSETTKNIVAFFNSVSEELQNLT